MSMTTSTLRGFALILLGTALGCDGSAIRKNHPKGTTSTPTTATSTLTSTATTTTTIDVPPEVTCPEGHTPCTSNRVVRCVDLTRSTSDCGRCGNACAPGIACEASVCQQYRCQGDVTFQALPGVVTIDVDSIYWNEDLCSYRPVLADFNRDGVLDFVGIPGIRAPMGMLLGNGDGTFHAIPIAADFADAWLASTADLNRDGWPDLVNTQAGQSKVWVRLGNGDATSILAAPTAYATAAPPDNVLLADLDSDGALDLAAGVGTTLQRWRGDESGAFTPVDGLPLGSAAKLLGMMDYDGDSMLDVVYGDTSLRMLLNRGPGSFSAPVACGLALDRSPVRSLGNFADLDQDGKIDLVTVTHGIMLGMNGCNFSSLTVPTDWFPATGRTIQFSDLNGDRQLDIVTRSWNTTDATSVLLGTGKGNFAKSQSYPTFGHQDDVAFLTGDLNKDTKLDLIVFRRDGWQVLLNTCR